jgi:hypothetical protein
MNNDKLKKQLQSMNACDESMIWVKCDRPYWMIWYLGKIEFDRQKISLIACDCASEALQYINNCDSRPIIATATAIKFLSGTATIEELRLTRVSSWEASIYSLDSVIRGASSAAWAASVACSCSSFIWSAMDSSIFSVNTACASGIISRTDANKKLCNLIRSRVSVEMIEKHLNSTKGVKNENN